MAKIILGLAGEIGSGKGTIAKYIAEKYNGTAYRFSTMLRDLLKRIYLKDTRENMQKISTIIRQNFGEDALAKVMYEDVGKDKRDFIVADGIRRLADIKYLKELPGFKLVYVETGLKERYERVKMRGENPDDSNKTLDQFKKEHEEEADLQIRDLKKHADFFVNNNGTTGDLYAQIDKIISEL